MPAPQNIIAVIFDFDDTLTDDSTTKLLESAGINTEQFWKKDMKQLMDDGWDPPLAYLKLMLDNVGDGKPLGKLTNAKLREFGSTLDFYSGIPEIFDELKKVADGHQVSRPTVEFYIISGGLEEIIKGSKIAGRFAGIWGSRFQEEGGQIRNVMNAISFTEKTKYLFSINKGLQDRARSHPYSVNHKVELPDRRIPFENMIYVGDGMTDVPCFSLMCSAPVETGRILRSG